MSNTTIETDAIFIERDTDRKIRHRNKLYDRVNHWPIWIFVFFIAPGPLTFDLFAGGFDSRMAAWLGVVRARMGALSGRTVDVLLVVLFAVPSTMVGVGLISIWNRPGLLGALYGTDGMLIVAYVARLLPMTVLALAASARSVAVSQEEAAAVSGAGWFSTIAHIVVPQMRMALVATWVIVFVLAFGELGVSLLVAPPGETTLPIRVYTIIANAPASTVASLALLQASVILMPLIVLGAYLARREAQ